MEIMVNDGQYAAGCVAKCELDGQDLELSLIHI